jgi:hypothetical protein
MVKDKFTSSEILCKVGNASKFMDFVTDNHFAIFRTPLQNYTKKLISLSWPPLPEGEGEGEKQIYSLV